MAQLGNSSNGTQVTIPDLTAPANIQDAFKLYHLGDLNLADDSLSPSANSIAGHLASMDARISNIVSVTSSELNSDDQDLNDLTTTENRYRLTTPPTGKNYPVLYGTNLSYPGILTVTKATKTGGNILIFQTYTMTNIPDGGDPVSNQRTAYFWRSKFNNGDWSLWYQAATQKSVSDLNANKQSIFSTSTANANKVIVVDSSGNLSTSGIADVVKSEIETLKGINSGSVVTTSLYYRLGQKADSNLANVSMTADNSKTFRDKLGVISYTGSTSAGNKIFIQSSAPTIAANPTLAVGDLWFW